MVAQQGFEYEKNAATVLKKYNLVPKEFNPAGARADQPDLLLEHNKVQAGCEMKIAPVSAGSLVIKYDIKDKNSPWKFDTTTDKEKLFLQNVAKQVKILDVLKTKWNEVPYKREQDALWKQTVGKMNIRERYARDLKTFTEVKGEIPSSIIEQYYNKKDTFYVNVGTHGFYLFGRKNPLKLNKVPLFSESSKAFYRARVQYKGSGQYQFTFELSFLMRKKSPHNIAPVNKGSVVIQENKLELGCFA